MSQVSPQYPYQPESRADFVSISRHLEYGLYLCGNVGRKAPFPRKGPWVAVQSQSIKSWLFIVTDVNQFSIITELLGTPPDDVIQTIASENVRDYGLGIK
jgi:hypothetical protein